MSDTTTGAIPATVQLLTLAQARIVAPSVFHGDESDPYFDEGGADGNVHWVDYWPDLMVVVRNLDGKVMMASAASRRWMQELGYGEERVMAERIHTCSHCGSTQPRSRYITYLHETLAEVLDDLERGRWDVHDLPADLRSRLRSFLAGA